MVDKGLSQVTVVVRVNNPRDWGILRLDDVEDKTTGSYRRPHECLVMPLFSRMSVVLPVTVLLPGCDLALNFFLVYPRDEFV